MPSRRKSSCHGLVGVLTVSFSALERINLKPEEVGEVLMGNVIAAGQGQHPARQVSLGAGIPISVRCRKNFQITIEWLLILYSL